MQSYKEKITVKLRGMLLLLFWINKKKHFFGARDQFGIKTLHITHEG